jgi:hypothetical protein
MTASKCRILILFCMARPHLYEKGIDSPAAEMATFSTAVSNFPQTATLLSILVPAPFRGLNETIPKIRQDQTHCLCAVRISKTRKLIGLRVRKASPSSHGLGGLDVQREKTARI